MSKNTRPVLSTGALLELFPRRLVATMLVALTVPLSLIGANSARAEPGTAASAEPNLAERTRVTGEWGGARTALEQKGIEVVLQYIGETLGVSGGVIPGGPHASYEGRLDMIVNTDLEKLLGWTGARTHVRAFQIHEANNKNTASYVGSIADPSNIDATPTTRLFTAWYQQEFGKYASIRLGQLAGDDEFLTSSTAGGLINGTFGWATIMAANLPSGGPAYPLATPGVRLQVNPTDNIALLGAVFSGDPAGKNCYTYDPTANPQICNKHGTTFSLDGGAFWLGEAQYNVNLEKDAKGLAASYKIGGWYHTGSFSDRHFGVDSTSGNVVSLALAPDGRLLHRGNWGLYGVIDQMVWRGTDRSASFFVRSGATPSDRNLVSWYIDGGVGFKGYVPGRADDTLTFGIAHSKISRDAIASDNDVFAIDGVFPRRSAETVFEVSYIAQIAPWWSLQPDFQYIVKPAGNVLRDSSDPSLGTIGDAYVFGVRTTMTF
jgi:porin